MSVWNTFLGVLSMTTAPLGMIPIPTLLKKCICPKSAIKRTNDRRALTILPWHLMVCASHPLTKSAPEIAYFTPIVRVVTVYIKQVCLRHLLQAADGTGLSHERSVNAIHPPVNSEVRPSDEHVGTDLK